MSTVARIRQSVLLNELCHVVAAADAGGAERWLQRQRWMTVTWLVRRHERRPTCLEMMDS